MPLPLRLALLDFPLPGITGLVAAPFGFPFAPGVPLDAPEPLYVPNQILGAFLALLKLGFGELVAGYEQVHVIVALAPAFAPRVAVDRSDVWVLPPFPVVGPLPGEVAEVLLCQALAVLGRDEDVDVLGGRRATVLGEILAILFGPLPLVVAAAVRLLDEALLVPRVLDVPPVALAGGPFSLLALLGPPRDVAGAAEGALRASRGVGVGDVVDVGAQDEGLTLARVLPSPPGALGGAPWRRPSCGWRQAAPSACGALRPRSGGSRGPPASPTVPFRGPLCDA